MFDALLAIDAAIRAWIASHHLPPLDLVMISLTVAGNRGALWMALAAAAVLVRPSAAGAAFRLLVAIGLTGLMTDAVLKPLFARDRPFSVIADVRLIADEPDTYSFPSGHAANAFAGGLALTRLWPRHTTPVWVLSCLVALSRVYVGVHYPSDVVGGALTGLLCSSFVLGGFGARPSGRRPAAP